MKNLNILNLIQINYILYSRFTFNRMLFISAQIKNWSGILFTCSTKIRWSVQHYCIAKNNSSPNDSELPYSSLCCCCCWLLPLAWWWWAWECADRVASATIGNAIQSMASNKSALLLFHFEEAIKRGNRVDFVVAHCWEETIGMKTSLKDYSVSEIKSGMGICLQNKKLN